MVATIPSPSPALRVEQRANSVPAHEVSISVDVSDERARPDHHIESTMPLLKEAVFELQERLLTGNISSIKVRPLTAEDSFYEILGYTEHGTYVSSTLIKCSLLEKSTVRAAVAGLTRRGSEIIEGKILRVYTSEPERARAYVNGVSLPRIVQTNFAEFRVIKSRVPGTHIAIAATADERPLIRKVARAEGLLNLIEWHMPEPSLSRR